MLKRYTSTSYSPLSLFIRIVLVFIAYVITARIGLSLHPVGGFAALIWPPTGIALAAVLLYGRTVWPAIALGAFLVNFMQGAEWYVAFIIATGNTLEALIGGLLLKRVAGFNRSFYNLKDVMVFIAYGAILSTLISSTIGSLAIFIGGSILNGALFREVWLAWWVGDILGALIIVPFILFWRDTIKKGLSFDFRTLTETALLFFLLVIISTTIFIGLFGIDASTAPIAYLLYLPLVFISLRFSPTGYATAMVIMSSIAIFGTVRGLGVFTRTDIPESLFLLQIFIGVTGLTFLPLAVLVQEKREFNLLKDEFLAIASHELKTPLTTIKAYNDLLRKRYSRKNTTSMREFRIIDEQIKIVVKLINEMLDITKISRKKAEIEREEFPITELVKKTVHAIQKTNHKRKFSVISKTNAYAYADSYKINQVLTNLLNNALKYSDIKDKIIVTVTSRGGIITVSVKDFGLGIKRGDLRNVFKRFYQARSTGKVGLGLGLYISNEIIKSHKGKMWVTSIYGKGSTFCFTLPAVKRS